MANPKSVKSAAKKAAGKAQSAGSQADNAAKRRGPKKVSDAHRAAIQRGRVEGAAVRAYLEALDAAAPKRGRRRTRDRVESELGQVESDLAGGVSPVDRLRLVQRRRDLAAELAGVDNRDRVAEAKPGFVEHARAYGERLGIEYASWREIGVPADVLAEAGITRR